MLKNLDIFSVISNNLEPKVGRILISEPLLIDDIFARSVILIAGMENKSAFGFILNNPSNKNLHELIEGVNIENIPVYIGGPVERDVLFCIHSIDYLPDSIPIADGIFLSGNFDNIKTLINRGIINSSNARFFIGNSGWAPKQLHEEINFNYWLVSETTREFVFSDSKNQWERALDFVDKRYEIWKNFPLNPELN
ncbi:MAG: YqgE/AlgH family protein [Bacteroidales bacterium]|jgi:putative transcriptional regulator|nr:YqgE/AlgH family protein [Bacteroidales bacterium]MCK9498861.1 YqgE/AlgH family protein [Bacteroidales bacterium]MDY0314812.1 YqgE/AlgH family protein [Bacteroidales bacterium]NLB85985.1 YqgE/AlgH family protein [Bacteroidales bacterium]